MPLDMVLHCCYRNKFINIFKEDDILFKRSEGDATAEELEDIPFYKCKGNKFTRFTFT